MVRLGFQQRPWDLYLVLAYAGILQVSFLVHGPSGLVGIPLLLFAPGYGVLAAGFPKRTDLDWVQRVAFSVALSVVLTPLVVFAEYFSYGRLDYGWALAGIVLVTVSVTCVGLYRRLALPVSDRVAIAIEIRRPSRNDRNYLDQLINYLVVASAISASVGAGYMALTWKTPQPPIEFYVLDSNGTASNYPASLRLNEVTTVIIGVRNHEPAKAQYRIVIDLVGIRLETNVTTGKIDAVETNRTSIGEYNLTMEGGAVWERPFAFMIRSVGLWRLDFLLLNGGDPVSKLHIYIKGTT